MTAWGGWGWGAEVLICEKHFNVCQVMYTFVTTALPKLEKLCGIMDAMYTNYK